MTSPLTMFQTAALVLFGLGVFGFVKRKTLVGMLIAVELMLNGAGLSIVAAGQYAASDPVAGQVIGLFVMGLAAAEATLVLAICMVVFKRLKTVEADRLAELKG